jgi:RNA polymerase sigma-70 factor (ECF subfamily)
VDEQSDDDLVREAQRGDPDAAELLVRRHARRLSAHLYRLTASVHDSEDLMQETFARFFGALADYRKEGRLRAYLLRIATNLAAHAREKAFRRDAGLEDHLVDRAPGPEEVAAGRQLTRRLGAAILELLAEQREALLLRTNEEMGYDDIARVQGASVSAVKVRVFRAREALRPLVTERTGSKERPLAALRASGTSAGGA